jgi:predicted DsbA family dithiol-disulfide isomerase
VAAEGGLDRAEVNEFLAGDRGRDEIRAAERNGQRLGLSGVPFFVINGAVALSGAQAPEVFRAAIEQATATAAGDACGVDPATGEAGMLSKWKSSKEAQR